MDVQSVIAAVQAAREIAKSIAKASSAGEIAAMKLQVLEIVDALGESKFALQQALAEQSELRSEVSRLKEALRTNGDLRKCGDAYFLANAAGEPHGDAYCVRCWQKDAVLFSLTRATDDLRTRVCPACNHRVRYNAIHWPADDERRPEDEGPSAVSVPIERR